MITVVFNWMAILLPIVLVGAALSALIWAMVMAFWRPLGWGWWILLALVTCSSCLAAALAFVSFVFALGMHD